VRGAERVGKRCPIVWDVEWSNTKIMKIKYTVGLIGRQLVDQNTTTNQKQAAATDGSMEGICDKQDAWGKHDAII
jgi:hypothetical protein